MLLTPSVQFVERKIKELRNVMGVTVPGTVGRSVKGRIGLITETYA